jgi:hypothetical protein
MQSYRAAPSARAVPGRMREGRVTSEEATTLWELRCRWGDAYRVTLADGVWAANRLANSTVVLTADTGEELRQAIRDDYAAWLRAGGQAALS